MLQRHPWRWVIAIVLGLIVLLAAYAGWLVYKVEKSLTAATHDASGLKSAMLAGDTATINARLGRLQRDSKAAADHADNPVWSLMTHAPVYGDDLRGVKVASDVVSDLSSGGLAQLADSVSKLDQLVPKGGKVDLSVVSQLQRPVDDGARQLAAARAKLDAQDPSGYVAALKGRFRTLQEDVGQAASAMATADTALKVMPAMLGDSSQQSYLLVLQNNAEIRATGGLPGAISLVTADHGRLAMTQQVAGDSFGERKGPVLPLSVDEKKLFTDRLGTFFLDANLTPDFARSADLWKARWEEVEGGQVDGVLSIDPVTLSYLLKATGPIRVGSFDLTSANVVDQLLHQVYLTYTDPAQQDEFFRQVATAVFEKVTSGAGSPTEIIKALVKGADEHRVYVHDFDAQVQQTLDGTAVAGELASKATAGPQVNVAFNDATAAKMSYYLRYQVSAASTYCTNGVQGLTGDVHISSDAPADAGSTLPEYVTGSGESGIQKGDQIVQMTIYGPYGGTVSNLLVNGKPTDAANITTATLDGRPATQVFVYLSPGKTWDISWQMKSGKGQTGPTTVNVTPSIVAGTSSSTVSSTC